MRIILSPGGVDETLRNCEEDKGTYSIPSNEDWETLFQYQEGLEPLTQLSHFTQNSKAIVHEELFMAKVTLQSLAALFFVMNDNLSAMTGSRHVKDLTVISHARINIKKQFWLNSNLIGDLETSWPCASFHSSKCCAVVNISKDCTIG